MGRARPSLSGPGGQHRLACAPQRGREVGAVWEGRGACCPAGIVNREPALHFAFRSNDDVEAGTPCGDIVVRRPGWLARALRESCPAWLQEVLLVAERRLPMALATAHYTGVQRSDQLGEP